MKTSKIKKTITIDAPVSEVWTAITDPQVISEYFFGSAVASEWKQGSSITYSGEYEGHPYQDKGVIEEIDREKILKHSYWSELAGIADREENYAHISYALKRKGSATELMVTQEVQKGSEAEDAYKDSEENWELVLDRMKDLLEHHEMRESF